MQWSYIFTCLILSSACIGGDWPIFRGDRAMQGIASCELSTELRRLWVFQAGDNVESSPVVTETTVFVGSSDGKLYAISRKDGKQIWVYDSKEMIEAPPLFVDGNIYVGNHYGKFVALNAETGTEVWSFEAEAKIVGSANWFTTEGKKNIIVFGAHDSRLYALDAKTGAKIWSYEADNYINGAPAMLGNASAIGSCDANLYLVRHHDGKLAAKIDTGAYIAGTVGVEGSLAWVGNYGNEFMCLDLQKGTKVWTYGDEEKGDPFFSSPAIGKDRVIIGGRDSFVHCLAKKDGKELWKFRTRDEVNSSPVIAGKHVVVGSDDGRLYMLKLINGTKVWSYEVGAGIISSPAVVDGHIYVGANDGRVYAFGK